jgi:2-(3-amino-3-carboxypropyl)histidine synthase
MEADRAEGNLGVAADLEENHEPIVQRQPKKRFVGRRQATELAGTGPSSGHSIENAVQGGSPSHS